MRISTETKFDGLLPRHFESYGLKLFGYLFVPGIASFSPRHNFAFSFRYGADTLRV
jgi:hypothetical protein